MWRSYEIGNMHPELLAAIIAIVKAHMDQWGSWPTPAQVQAQLGK